MHCCSEDWKVAYILSPQPSGGSSSSLKVDGWKEENQITLHEASKRQNPCNKFYGDN